MAEPRTTERAAIAGHLSDLEAAWTAIRRHRLEWVWEVAEVAALPERRAHKLVSALVVAGVLAWRAGKHPGRFRVARDCGAHPPHIRPDGRPNRSAERRHRMWNVMRAMKQFSVEDLALAASTPTNRVLALDADRYVRALLAPGIVFRVAPTIYMMNRAGATGSRAPRVSYSGAVMDPNANRLWRPRYGWQSLTPIDTTKQRAA